MTKVARQTSPPHSSFVIRHCNRHRWPSRHRRYHRSHPAATVWCLVSAGAGRCPIAWDPPGTPPPLSKALRGTRASAHGRGGYI